ncbi:FMN-dependent NADH-azoreductase [Herbaspirillum sp. YR522]|uniref:FMN-dependent NADH-azoreductase n=1 Tax=Herbaspirillum sp. YR522 TaxID=1144342 RepID=UPI00026FAAAC|nr:NAD(P)H-dependent oxidoreductase [Herbaspirillum sp. YR522]EJN08785.1 acyl carrier protein phosphodiesterase [Herbaspirillum sp. YR522]
MKILHIAASPKSQDANAWWLAQRIIARLADGHVAVELTVRDLHATPVAHIDAEYADALAAPAEPEEQPSAGSSRALSEQLINEVEAADCLVIGTPMHNYTVPSSLKAWIDHVVRVRRTFSITPNGKVGLLRDRPVYVGVVAGGGLNGARARQPDFLRPYLKVALATIGLHDLRFFTMERLASGAQAVLAERERVMATLGPCDFFLKKIS